MSWLDWVGPVLGLLGIGQHLRHRKVTKVLATASQVRRLARDAAFAIAAVTKNDRAASIANLVEQWSRKFDALVVLAGLKLTEKQGSEALAEAQKTFHQLGLAAVDLAADRLSGAAENLAKEIDRLKREGKW